MLQCYAVTLISVPCNNVTTTGGRECVYLHAQNLAKTKEIELVHQICRGLGRWFPGRVGQNLSRTEAKA